MNGFTDSYNDKQNITTQPNQSRNQRVNGQTPYPNPSNEAAIHPGQAIPSATHISDRPQGSKQPPLSQGHRNQQAMQESPFDQQTSYTSRQNVQPHSAHQQNIPPHLRRPGHSRQFTLPSRPVPTPRQLGDPGTSGFLSDRRFPNRPPHQAFEGPSQAQVTFLELLAGDEVPKAEMTLKELDEKEDLRLKLQDLCRKTIVQYENKSGDSFDASSVMLKCFGSLSTGFATLSSDMDLALVSPNSKPEPSSPQSKIPRLLEKALLDAGFGARYLTRTRVPIIKFCEQPTPKLAEALREERAQWEAEDARQMSSQISNSPEDPGATTSGFEQARVENDLALKDNPNARKPRTDQELARLYKLAMQERCLEGNERLIVNKFLEAVAVQQINGDNKELDAARSALQSVRKDVLDGYRPPFEDHLDFSRADVGIQCDINFSNALALHNTRLLRCYSLCDPRVRPMVLFVKAWARRRKINTPYRGTLSSYGYVLMVLHYLANVVEPPVLPNLQTSQKAIRDKSPENDLVIDGYGVRFWRSENEIRELARRKLLTRNTEDGLGILLCGFFHYYAYQDGYTPSGGFPWHTDVLSLRTQGGLLKKRMKGWTGAKSTRVDGYDPGQEQVEIKHRYLLAIEDPFEHDHNIARTVSPLGYDSIREEFRRAIAIIQSVGPRGTSGYEDLFLEVKERNFPRKAFGPLPRKNDHTNPNPNAEAGVDQLNKERKSEGAPMNNTISNGKSDSPPASQGEVVASVNGPNFIGQEQRSEPTMKDNLAMSPKQRNRWKDAASQPASRQQNARRKQKRKPAATDPSNSSTPTPQDSSQHWQTSDQQQSPPNDSSVAW